jgi:hypothetical protein
MVGTIDDYRNGYRDQYAYISKRTLEAIDELLKNAGGDRIILIQGDHGPKSSMDQNSLQNTDVPEVFNILSAYRVPEQIRSSLYSSITPMNSFRILLSGLFKEDLTPLPDRSFYSTWDHPLRFEEVTKELKAP